MALPGLSRAVLASRVVAASKTYAGVDKIVCLGKQYVEHAKELGDAVPERPVIFHKFGSLAHRAAEGQKLDLSGILPRDKGAVHYEAEICLQLGVAGSISAVTLGLDLTLRELQAQLKRDGHPWVVGKNFPGSAVVGPWIPVAQFPAFLEEEFTFRLDGELRQRARGAQMRLGPEQAVSYVEEHFPLGEGDILFTGTPAGVGPAQPGQVGELRWGERLSYQVQF